MAEEMDDFDKAFAEAAAAAESSVAAPAPEPAPAAAPAPEPAPAAAPPSGESSAPASGVQKDATPAGDPPASEPAPAPAPAPAAAAPAPVPAPPPTPEPPKETPEQKAAREAFEESLKPYEPSAEEKAALDKFAKDFPEEYAAMEARFKSTDRVINARVHQAVQAVLQHMNATVTPIAEGYTADAQERHFAALHTAHADYDAVIAKFPDWVKTQPAYVQPALQHVYNEGSTQEVIAMVADMKKAAGIVPAAPAAAPAPTPAPTPRPASGADDLAPVGSRRVTPTPRGTPDPNDYDGAFAEAVRAMG